MDFPRPSVSPSNIIGDLKDRFGFGGAKQRAYDEERTTMNMMSMVTMMQALMILGISMHLLLRQIPMIARIYDAFYGGASVSYFVLCFVLHNFTSSGKFK
mgnify:CR=1 FL=1